MKIIEGWFDWECGAEGALYTTKSSWERGNPYSNEVVSLPDFTEEFANKKIRIKIEEIEE